MQRERAVALPDLAVDHARGAVGWGLARAHDQGGAAAILLEGLDGARDGDERAIGEPPDATGIVAGESLAQRLVLDRARIGVG